MKYKSYGTRSSSGVGASAVSFTSMLQVAFIVLKLCDKIEWSWWVVLIPLWIDLGLAVVLLIGFIIYIKKEW